MRGWQLSDELLELLGLAARLDLQSLLCDLFDTVLENEDVTVGAVDALRGRSLQLQAMTKIAMIGGISPDEMIQDEDVLVKMAIR